MNRKILVYGLPILLSAMLLLSARAADHIATLIFKGPNGPTTASIENASVESALRLLVESPASYFPRGTKVDRVTTVVDGYSLYLTFPVGFRALLDETVTDPMMHSLGQTMLSLAPGKACHVFVHDDKLLPYRPIGKWKQDAAPLPQKPYEEQHKNGPPGYGQGRPTGFLNGKSIFLAPGHGWYESDTYGWTTQRGNTNGIVEDLSNAEAVFQFLMPYVWNAGANVYTTRERDLNTEMVVIDNNDAGFSSTGNWFSSTSVAGYYGDDYLAAQVSVTETATASFTADLAADGFYHVYAWYTMGANRAADCRIAIGHAEGETLWTQNLNRDGFTWKELGRYYFRMDDPPEKRRVTISNIGSNTASYVIADAVRFGGGLHEEADKPRWEMSGMYHAPFMGCDDCVTNTVTTMPLYTKWENEAGWEDGIYLSWHTNAPNPGTGTSTFAYSSGGWDGAFDGVSGSLGLRAAVHNEVMNDIRAGWDANWGDRGQHTNWYGEINPNYNDETPGIILEVAFHDTPADAEDLKEPEFRQLVARAVYQAIVRYYADRDGLSPHFLPEPPHSVAVTWNGETADVSWLPPPYDNGGLAGDEAEGYRIYLGNSGKGFADGIELTGNRASVALSHKDEQPIYLRFTAYNEGGESFPTETLAVTTGTGPRVLLVNGFDRIDKYANVPESFDGGTIYRGFQQRMNTYDYTIAHAKALAAAGIQFDSASNEAVQQGAVELADYPAVVWLLGEESTANISFTPTEQTILADYLDGGGALFVSGSEIGWDLWENGTAADRAFYADYLRAEYLADSAGTGGIAASGIFAGIAPFAFDYLDYLIYAANYPDCLAALPGGYGDLIYSGTDCAAAVVTDTGTFKVIYMGFPFETIFDEATREQIMAAAMDYLLPVTDDDTVDDDAIDDDVIDDDLTDDDLTDDDANDDDVGDDDVGDDDENTDDDNVDDDAQTDDDQQNDDDSEDDDAGPGGSGQDDDDNDAGCGCR